LWQGLASEPHRPPCQGRNADAEPRVRQDWVNRSFVQNEAEFSQAQTLDAGLKFIEHNHQADNWLLQLEIFDPHEPFRSPRKYKDRYAEHYDAYKKAGGKLNDWPYYRLADEKPAQVEHLRHEYAALVSMCDASLGDVLDAMDQYDLWKDTMLVVWTDHGFMLGEHGFWAKNWMPFYEEVSHTPFFVWDPRCGKRGERRTSLVQPALDLPLTLLNYFGVKPTPDMLGKDLAPAIADDAALRPAALFGMHGGQVNVTDGRYVYQRAPENWRQVPAYEYTVMGCHIRSRMSVERLRQATLASSFAFTKGCPLLRVPSEERVWHESVFASQLFDLQNDPQQLRPLSDASVESRMTHLLLDLMHQCEAPAELYRRLGLKA
jgi:arylsulfatase A-like enzyme